MSDKFPMTLIDTRLLNNLLLEAAANDPDSPPTFTPDPDYGEGTPSKEEMSYREEMLLLLGLLFLKVSDIQKGKGSGYQKQSQIEAEINKWMTDAKTALDKHLDTNHAAGVTAAQKDMLAHGIAPTNPVGRAAYYDIIHQQQLNLESIARELGDSLRNNLAVMQTEKNFKIPKDHLTGFNIHTYFNRAQNRIEKMTVYGATSSRLEGQMSGFYDWQDVLLLDWVSMHDKRVCRTCKLYERMGPYSFKQFPFIPHPGCRCHAVISEKVPQDMGMFLPLALTTDYLLNKE